jgi:hypothetical protein
MGRFLAGVGLAAMFGWFFRRRRKHEPIERADPAAELKRRLAESRAAEPEPQPEPEPPAEPQAPAKPLDERRRAIHDRAQAAIDQMRGDVPDE